MKPMDIEKQSFAIIEKELTTDIPPEYKPVVKRVIHTTADKHDVFRWRYRESTDGNP